MITTWQNRLAWLPAGETLSLAADLTSSKKPRVDPELKQARRCYDHLAGNLGVAICDRLITDRRIMVGGDGFIISTQGAHWLQQIGLAPPENLRRPLVRPCLDWTERRPHVAGWLGAALCANLEEKAAFRRTPNSRTLRVTSKGKSLLREQFGLDWPA